MRHIFLSYAREDEKVMRRLCADLEAGGIPTWTDEHLTPGTQDWQVAIEQAIEQAGGLVAILSPDAKRSKWVREELNYALAQGVRIFHVLARGDASNAIPIGHTVAQWADIRDEADYPAAVQELLDAIKRHLAEPEHEEALPEKRAAKPPPLRGKRRGFNPLWGAGAVVAVALVVGLLALLGVFGPQEGTQDITPTPLPPTATEAVAVAPSPTASLSPTVAPSATSTQTPIPQGLPGNPVTANRQWEPVTQEFGGVEMVLVPVGCFMMGSTDEEIDFAFQTCENALGEGQCYRGNYTPESPQHEMCFDEPFWIDKYEVTNLQYGLPGHFEGDDLPRDSVSWFDAVAHCESRGVRLPTEAEWEYAARGPDGLLYPWGNAFVTANAVNERNSDDEPAAVGSRPAGESWVGALDMSGNVWEWVSSIHAPYPYDADDGRESVASFEARVLRGGSYDSHKAYLRTTMRASGLPTASDWDFGFRCARSY